MIPDSLRPRLEFAAKAFLNASFAGVVVAGALRLHQRALEDPGHHVDLGAWCVVERPEWLAVDDVVALREATGLEGRRVSVLDRSTTDAVLAGLSRPHLVRRVVALRRRMPDRFEAVLELRRPAAVVRLAGPPVRFVEVDEDGVVLTLPHETRPERAGLRLRLVRGAVAAPGEIGSRFGADVQAAVRLAVEIERAVASRPAPELDDVDVIDVANFGGRTGAARSEIVLELRERGAETPCRIEWGRTDRAADPAARPFEGKLDHLLAALRRNPGLRGARTVKVAFEDLVVVPARPSPPTDP